MQIEIIILILAWISKVVSSIKNYEVDEKEQKLCPDSKKQQKTITINRNGIFNTWPEQIIKKYNNIDEYCSGMMLVALLRTMCIIRMFLAHSYFQTNL